MDHQQPRQSPVDEHLPPSAATDEGKARFRPLAPKEPTSRTDTGATDLRRTPSGAEEARRDLKDLTFVNVTDPQQSKSSASRKFVRTHVMKNFAKEKRRQKGSPGVVSPNEKLDPFIAADSLLGVPRLLSTTPPEIGRASLASYNESIAPSAIRQASLPGSYCSPPAFMDPTFQARPQSPSGVSTSRQATTNDPANIMTAPSSMTGIGRPPWPIGFDQRALVLAKHCFAPAFRACHPLYMISLLADRSVSKRYAFCIDIDDRGTPDINEDAPSKATSLLFRLAEDSSSLAHALLMVAASHLSVQQDGKINSHEVVHHKGLALSFLNDAVQQLPHSNYYECLATVAVLASHELMVGDYNECTVHLVGFSRMVDLQGGLTSLSEDSQIRKLIQWSDQMGALLMNTRPLFPATQAINLFPSPRDTLPLSLIHDLTPTFQNLSSPFQHLAAIGKISHDLTQVLEDISSLTSTGPQTILNQTLQTPDYLISIRDNLVHRLLSAAPANETEDELSDQECIRLAALIFTLHKLFTPFLPPVYYRLTYLLADRLRLCVIGNPWTSEWATNQECGWGLLWICFVGVMVDNESSVRSWEALKALAVTVHRTLSLHLDRPLSMDVALDEVVDNTSTYYSDVDIRRFEELLSQHEEERGIS